jgi:hypothetical protein
MYEGTKRNKPERRSMEETNVAGFAHMNLINIPNLI